MRTTYQKQWLAYVALFICGVSVLIPANGNSTIKFAQFAALLIAGILAFIYMYYNIRKQAGINKKWLGVIVLFIAFFSIPISSYRNETIMMAKNIALAINFILVLIFLYYNRHNKVLMKRGILVGLAFAAIGVMTYYFKTAR
ncbi:hypothetical protein [Edaphocola aurantiacus]|uniref:hypothetical protein n=1 Tax=Edaphocola aurantiacus TaxID=2601682 RepID=UPI001C9730DD|nr:hypothetical protein [Edaphocola aurantiacus]